MLSKLGETNFLSISHGVAVDVRLSSNPLSGPDKLCRRLSSHCLAERANQLAYHASRFNSVRPRAPATFGLSATAGGQIEHGKNLEFPDTAADDGIL
jgi:hypothetical protein